MAKVPFYDPMIRPLEKLHIQTIDISGYSKNPTGICCIILLFSIIKISPLSFANAISEKGESVSQICVVKF